MWASGWCGGVSSWADLPGEIPKEKLPEALRFGSEAGKNIVVAEYSFEGTKADDLYLTLNGLDFDKAQTYQVAFDGEVYSCTSSVNDDGQGMGYNNVWIGNASLRSSSLNNTGEPFLFILYGATGVCDLYASTDGSHTIEIYTETESIVPLSEKYIQFTSPDGTKWKLSVSDDGTITAVKA